jgi:hypothetical protein
MIGGMMTEIIFELEQEYRRVVVFPAAARRKALERAPVRERPAVESRRSLGRWLAARTPRTESPRLT